jgi:hypothetical protein
MKSIFVAVASLIVTITAVPDPLTTPRAELAPRQDDPALVGWVDAINGECKLRLCYPLPRRPVLRLRAATLATLAVLLLPDLPRLALRLLEVRPNLLVPPHQVMLLPSITLSHWLASLVLSLCFLACSEAILGTGHRHMDAGSGDCFINWLSEPLVIVEKLDLDQVWLAYLHQ